MHGPESSLFLLKFLFKLQNNVGLLVSIPVHWLDVQCYVLMSIRLLRNERDHDRSDYFYFSDALISVGKYSE